MANVSRRSAALCSAVIAIPGIAYPPAAQAGLQVLFGVIARVLIGNGIRTAVKVVAPVAVATPFRRFLVTVATGYGIAEAQAALVAERAERAGAETIAKAGVHHDVLLKIRNVSAESVVVRGSMLELVNLHNGEVEESHRIGVLQVPARSEIEVPVTIRRFPTEGLKQLRISVGDQVLAHGVRFWGAT